MLCFGILGCCTESGCIHAWCKHKSGFLVTYVWNLDLWDSLTDWVSCTKFDKISFMISDICNKACSRRLCSAMQIHGEYKRIINMRPVESLQKNILCCSLILLFKSGSLHSIRHKSLAVVFLTESKHLTDELYTWCILDWDYTAPGRVK